MTQPLTRFRAVLASAGLDGRVVDACAVHFGLVLKWNPTHNLTRVTDEEGAAVLHYLDCALPLLDLAPPAEFIDVGSGAGFPGLVAAILWPEVPAVLVEPARKRASFLQVAAGELGLRRVTVRSPEEQAGVSSSWVSSRATFSAGARSTLWPYVGSNGALFAWTTPHERATWEKEAATWAPSSVTWRPYQLPITNGAGEHAEAPGRGLLVVRRG